MTNDSSDYSLPTTHKNSQKAEHPATATGRTGRAGTQVGIIHTHPGATPALRLVLFVHPSSPVLKSPPLVGGTCGVGKVVESGCAVWLIALPFRGLCQFKYWGGCDLLCYPMPQSIILGKTSTCLKRLRCCLSRISFYALSSRLLVTVEACSPRLCHVSLVMRLSCLSSPQGCLVSFLPAAGRTPLAQVCRRTDGVSQPACAMAFPAFSQRWAVYCSGTLRRLCSLGEGKSISPAVPYRSCSSSLLCRAPRRSV